MQDPQIPNFYLVNLGTDAFLRILTGPWAANHNSTPNIYFCLVLPFAKMYDTSPWPKTLGGDIFGRNPLFGVKADPLGLGVQMTSPKTTCEELIRPCKFCAALANKLKVMALFRSDARMHGHTEVRMHGPRPASLPLGFFAWETKNPSNFLPHLSFLLKDFKLAFWWYPEQLILELIKGLKIPNLLETSRPFVHSITCLLFFSTKL